MNAQIKKIQPFSDSLVGTPLERISLERILQNVDDNNIWNPDKTEVDKIKDDVTMLYHVISEVYNREKQLKEISREYQISTRTLSYWRNNNDVPSLLKQYSLSYLPETSDQRNAFAYLLGTISVKHVGKKRSQHSFKRSINFQAGRKRLDSALKIITGKRSARDGGKSGKARIVENRLFVQVLHYIAENSLDEYVNNDRERIAYLRGFFDASNIGFVKHGETALRYTIQSEDADNIDNLLSAFFELGVYPNIQDNGYKLVFEDITDIKKLVDLGIITLEADVSLIERTYTQNNKINYSLETYFAVRKRVKSCLKNKEKPNWKELTAEFGPDRVTLNSWTQDLTGNNSYRRQTPNAAQRYNKILEWLSLSNIYEDDNPVQRNEKWFIPVKDGRIFCLDEVMQQQYLNQYQLPHTSVTYEDIVHLQEELEKQLLADALTHQKIDTNAVDRDRDLRISYKGVKITSIMLPKTTHGASKIHELVHAVGKRSGSYELRELFAVH